MKKIDNKKIYIIGPSGSGKTTLARKMSSIYDIKSYELDCVVYDDENNHIRRSDKEINEIFENIISNDSWIVEDTGRNIFDRGLDVCDKIYYLKINRFRVYARVVKRWIRQILGKEKYNYPPTLWQFYDMFKTAVKYFKKEKSKILKLEKYKNKTEFLSYKDLNNF